MMQIFLRFSWLRKANRESQKLSLFEIKTVNNNKKRRGVSKHLQGLWVKTNQSDLFVYIWSKGDNPLLRWVKNLSALIC